VQQEFEEIRTLLVKHSEIVNITRGFLEYACKNNRSKVAQIGRMLWILTYFPKCQIKQVFTIYRRLKKCQIKKARERLLTVSSYS